MRERTRDVVTAVVLLAGGVLLLVLPIAAAPVVAVLPTNGARLPAVLIRPAFGVLLLWSGLVRLVLRRREPLAIVLADLALTAPVTVFLIALLNDVTDVLALVPLYALTTAAWLLAVLQPRVRVEPGHPLLPLCFAAGVGIVPWGVIALAQVTGDPPAGVRVVTLVALAGQLVVAVLLWRAARTGRAVPACVAAALAILVTAVGAVLLG